VAKQRPSKKRTGKVNQKASSEAERDVEQSQAWPTPESALHGGRTPQTLAEMRKSLKVRDPKSTDGREEFPEEAELEYERSVIRIPFYLKRASKKGRSVDVMNFDAYMRIIREAPIRSGLGVRQFEFYIDAWELTNTYSEGLNADVTFTLSDTIQPKSVCIALQRDADYPAMIVYNAIYDIYLGSERIVENQPGTAFASPVWQIPPRNVTVAFEKPFESDLFNFSAGCCEGMRSIDRKEFEAALKLAESIRGGDPGPPVAR
jgi:hypothetical protein